MICAIREWEISTCFITVFICFLLGEKITPADTSLFDVILWRAGDSITSRGIQLRRWRSVRLKWRMGCAQVDSCQSTRFSRKWIAEKKLRVQSHFLALAIVFNTWPSSTFRREVKLSLQSSKSTFGSPNLHVQDKCFREVVRIGSIIIFRLGKLWKAKFFILWCNISGEAAGKIWNWSLLGVKGLELFTKKSFCNSWLLIIRRVVQSSNLIHTNSIRL